MGMIDLFIRRAEEAGLRNEVPNESLFLAQGEGVCLILSRGLPDEGDEGHALLAFGEPNSPAEHPPRLALRHQLIGNTWGLAIESDDEVPAELTDFAKQNFCLEETDVVLDVTDMLESAFDIFLARVMRPSLACAS